MHERFDLPGELTIYTASEVRQSLLAWLARQDNADDAPLEIGAASVGDVDGAGLQLLGALARTLNARGLPWTLRDGSPTLREAAAALGCAGWLAQAGSGAQP